MNTQSSQPPADNDGQRAPEHTVGSWMTTPAITVTLEAQISEALALMHEHSIRRLPVVADTGGVCGIITDGDVRGAEVMRATGMDLLEIATLLRHTMVYDVMTPQPITVMPDTPLRDAAVLMLDNKIGGLPVVTVDNDVIGVITESDLFEVLVCYLDHDASTAMDACSL